MAIVPPQRSAQYAARSCPPGVCGDSGHLTARQGREHEWMFASEEGQAQVAASCRSRRTILVSMRRGQQYGGIAALKVRLLRSCCGGCDVCSGLGLRVNLTSTLTRTRTGTRTKPGPDHDLNPDPNPNPYPVLRCSENGTVRRPPCGNHAAPAGGATVTSTCTTAVRPVVFEPQAELSPLVLPLAPLASRVAPETIPFQSLAEGAGSRTLVAQVPGPPTPRSALRSVCVVACMCPRCTLQQELMLRKQSTDCAMASARHRSRTSCCSQKPEAQR